MLLFFCSVDAGVSCEDDAVEQHVRGKIPEHLNFGLKPNLDFKSTACYIMTPIQTACMGLNISCFGVKQETKVMDLTISLATNE